MRSRWKEGLGVFKGFFVIGATAFGGGSATLAAIQRLSVKHGWLSRQEFLDSLVLSRITPGISILAQVYLIGQRVCGLLGVIAGTLGLMIPAVVITVGLARFYDVVSERALAKTPIACVVAVAAGFAIALTLRLLWDTVVGGNIVLSLMGITCYGVVVRLINNPLAVLVAATALGFVIPSLFSSRLPPDEH